MLEYLPVGEHHVMPPRASEDETKKMELNQDEVVVGAADWNDGNLWPRFLCTTMPHTIDPVQVSPTLQTDRQTDRNSYNNRLYQ